VTKEDVSHLLWYPGPSRDKVRQERESPSQARRGRLPVVTRGEDTRFDMLVIGSGPAGEKAAAQAAYFGKRVAVVDREPAPGGAMVASAVATKAMREAALYLTGFRRHEIYGVGLELDPQAVIDRLRSREERVAEMMTEAVRENLRRHQVDLVHGSARLGPGRTLVVDPADGAPSRVLEADAILIATGSRPFHPEGVAFDDPDILDSESARALDRPLKSLVVVGGGAVACEYAAIFLALGAEVTLVDRGRRLLPFLDAQISDLLAESFRSFGMRVLSSTALVAVRREPAGLCAETSDGESIRPEKIVFAAGRVGNTEGLGLEEVGVSTDERGRIVVDEHYETTAPGIYAAGDVIGPPALASAAMEQGRVAACYSMAIPFKRTVDPLTPFGVYSIPECAMVGVTEEDARRSGVDCEIGVARFADNSRAAIAGSTEGVVKLVARRDDRQLVGVHILGEGATELVHQGQTVMHFGGTIDYFIHATFDVPTVSDIYKYAAYDCLQRLARGQPMGSPNVSGRAPGS
jgi:NAD(P) transhydrogenase